MAYQCNPYPQKEIEIGISRFVWLITWDSSHADQGSIACIYTSCKLQILWTFSHHIIITYVCNENASHEAIPARHAYVLQCGNLGPRVTKTHHRSTKAHLTATSRLRDMELKGLSWKHIRSSLNCHSDWLPSNWLCCSLQKWESRWSRHRRRVEKKRIWLEIKFGWLRSSGMISKSHLEPMLTIEMRIKEYPSHGDPTTVQAGLDQTISDLGLEYLDLYLCTDQFPVHQKITKNIYPYSLPSQFHKAWHWYLSDLASMLTLPKSKVRHVGICNFSPAQLKTLITSTGRKPYAHQMELHPYLQQSSWIKLHKQLGISATAYSPLGNSNPTYHNGEEKDYPPALLGNKVLVKIAEKRNCNAA